MSYIKVSNEGILDIVKACSMLGASVKTDKDSAIGMFGTGLKYALAQAARLGTKVFIASGNYVFETVLTDDSFRGVDFKKVNLRDVNTGEMHSTPITTNFGQHDWTDPWYVYREVVCNAMDEPGCQVTLVDSVRRNKKRTAIFLDYATFGEFYDREHDYFTKKKGDFVKSGTGIVYKKGVRVGQIQGLNLDMQYNYVSMSESRQMCDYSARYAFAHMVSRSDNADVWESFLRSDDYDKYDIDTTLHRDANVAFRRALKRIVGKFCLTPDAPHVIMDVKNQGVHPFVKPTNWRLREDDLPSYRDVLVTVTDDVVREPHPSERKLLAWGLDQCRAFGIKTTRKVRVFDNEGAMLGCCHMKADDIWVNSRVFQDRRELLMTLFEEFGHAESQASDYTREFTDYFIGKMVDFCIGG